MEDYRFPVGALDEYVLRRRISRALWRTNPCMDGVALEEKGEGGVHNWQLKRVGKILGLLSET